MPTFSNLAYFELVGNQNLLLPLQAEMPTSDFFLLPTTLQYATFEKVGIKNANLATLKGLQVYLSSIKTKVATNFFFFFFFWPIPPPPPPGGGNSLFLFFIFFFLPKFFFFFFYLFIYFSFFLFLPKIGLSLKGIIGH